MRRGVPLRALKYRIYGGIKVILLASLSIGVCADWSPSSIARSTLVAPVSAQESSCPHWRAPLPFGGASDSEVTLEASRRWTRFRTQRERERLEEAYTPEKIYARYRVEWSAILAGCLTIPQLIDLGRAIFLRRFTAAEGYGHGLKGEKRRRRFQRGHFGGPDASACVDCHWKGGFAGSGGRADNAYLFGDGEHLTAHEPRNPPALWGSGWVELIAQEMSATLQTQRDDAISSARSTDRPQRVKLVAKGVSFGWLSVDASGAPRYDEVEGVDHDLIIKPFGWRGVFPTLREFVVVSAHKHFSLQAEEGVNTPPQELSLGSIQGPDPDGDGVTRELTEGQISALVAFLATLDPPVIHIPQESVFRDPVFVGEAQYIPAPELTSRWQEGSQLFEQIGCSGCHVPMMSVKRPIYTLRAPSSDQAIELDLSTWSAKPHPDLDETGHYSLPTFSDFKRHKMGDRLAGLYAQRGVPAEVYLTRRLWGLAQTSPYLHTGGALTLDEVVYAHGGTDSEARFAAEEYESLSEGKRGSVRLFLESLRRAPAVRIR
jgi:hypothetical protein